MENAILVAAQSAKIAWDVTVSPHLVASLINVYVNSGSTGYEAAYERYKRLQRYKCLKNNVADFAESSEFESENLALSRIGRFVTQPITCVYARCRARAHPPVQFIRTPAEALTA